MFSRSPLDELWTFQSAMGVRRQIDFVLRSSYLSLSFAYATQDLDMGSDPRAV